MSGLPGHDAAEDDGDPAVKDGAGHQRGQDADGHVALRIPALFGRGRNGVEADIGEENDGAAGEDAGPAIGHEGMPVVRLDEAGCGDDEDEDGGDLDEDHDVVGARRLADAAHQDHRQDHHDEERREFEAEVPAGIVEIVARQVLQAGGQIGGRDPIGSDGWMPNQSIMSTMCAAKPTLTLMLEKAYSRIRSQPMIQATSSPMVT